MPVRPNTYNVVTFKDAIQQRSAPSAKVDTPASSGPTYQSGNANVASSVNTDTLRNAAAFMSPRAIKPVSVLDVNPPRADIATSIHSGYASHRLSDITTTPVFEQIAEALAAGIVPRLVGADVQVRQNIQEAFLSDDSAMLALAHRVRSLSGGDVIIRQATTHPAPRAVFSNIEPPFWLTDATLSALGHPTPDCLAEL